MERSPQQLQSVFNDAERRNVMISSVAMLPSVIKTEAFRIIADGRLRESANACRFSLSEMPHRNFKDHGMTLQNNSGMHVFRNVKQ